MRTIFCIHQNSCKRNDASKIPSTSFEGCENFVRSENPLSLEIHPSLGHQILQHIDYEATFASTLSLSRRASWNESLLFAYFYGIRSLEHGTGQMQMDFEPRFCRVRKNQVQVKTTVMVTSSQLN